jgi:DNA-binding beta-propeller fold protein YncE
VVLLPDRTKALVNVAGDNRLAFLDLAAGQVEAAIDMGAFPWDIHLTPDGRFGYVPERDQDTVSKVDLATRAVVQTATFPAGSKPHMLRVSRDGKEVWVQTAVDNTNVVLDADDLAVLATEPTGKGPVTNAWTPDGRYSFVINNADTFVSVFDAGTYREVKRLEVGEGGANIGFSRDGNTAFVSVAGANVVAVVDLPTLEVVGQVPTGPQPMGLIVL